VVRGHPFFSMTFAAEKSSEKQVKRLMYRGPFAAVLTHDGVLLRPGSTYEISSFERLDEPAQVLELDAAGNVTNADIGGSSCCAAPDPGENGLRGEASGCCAKPPESIARKESDPSRKRSRGCMSCGAPLHYADEERQVRCEFCGGDFRSSVFCEHGHFVCDICHIGDSLAVMERECVRTRETDMISLFRKVRSHPVIPLHGPQYHALVPGVILATYRNLGGDLSDAKIRSGIRRGSEIPGGACGFMGACGAAVGTGIAFSVMLESNPLAPRERRTAQAVTSAVLAEMSKLEAARCCQRECFIAFEKAAELSKTLLPLELRADGPIACEQMDANDECLGPECPLYATVELETPTTP
jgi:hypothetical protein